MKLDGAKPRAEKTMNLMGVDITIKPVGLRVWLLINSKILDPKPITLTNSKTGVTQEDRSPEYLAQCEEMDMARLMVMFYFCVRHNPTLQFETPKREIDSIDSTWALALLKEISDFLQIQDLAEIKNVIMSATGIEDSEVTRAREGFLAQQG